MRDDLHKSAPVPRAWKRFIAVCRNDVDAGERGWARARQAALSCLKEDVRENFLRDVARTAETPVFSAHQMLAPFREDPELSGREAELLNHFDRLSQDGLCGNELGRAAFHDFLSCDREAKLRQIEGYYRTHAPAEYKQVMKRLRASLSAGADLGSLAGELIPGKVPTAPEARVRRLDLDENLLPPNGSSMGQVKDD